MNDARTTAFTAGALKLGLITPAQAEECSALHSKLTALGFVAPIEAVFTQKGYLGKPQLVAIASCVDIGSEHAIPGFDILEKIAEGGMGAVYKARQRSMDRLVAIKMLLPKHADDLHARERFLREARAVAKLSHPNVVAGFDVGEAAGVWYFVMEFLDGESLEQRLRRGALDWHSSLAIIRQVACALEHAHLHGVVHRDVKPSNIMLVIDGTVKLADLGLARTPNGGEATLTQSGMVIGSPAYVSPEQAMGDRSLDSRSDLFSLGVTWYECLVGERAFLGSNPVSVMSAILTRDVPLEKLALAQVPPAGIAMIQALTQRDPQARYATPKALILDIDAILAGQPLRGISVPIIPRLGQEIGQTTASPGISSAGISSPGISSPGISSPGISSADISSPGISSADISSTDIPSTDIPSVRSLAPALNVLPAHAGQRAKNPLLQPLRLTILALSAVAISLGVWTQVRVPSTPLRPEPALTQTERSPPSLNAPALPINPPIFVAGKLDLLSAVARAQALVGNALIYHAERERDIYSIDFATGKLTKNVEIHAHTGALNAIADEVDDHSVDVASSLIEFSEAVRTALGAVPGEVVEAEIVLHPGRSQIDVSIRTAQNLQIVSIDARSGLIIGTPMRRALR